MAAGSTGSPGSAARASHVVVVGGGIAGLAAARELLVARPDVQVTVLEGASEVGGKLRVGEIAGIPVDLGAESMLNRRPEGTDLARSVGLGEHLVHPRVSGAGVWTRGAVRPLPPTLMGIPANLGVAADSGILSRFGVARAQLERGMPRLDLTEDVGIGRLVARRLGPQVRDRLVEPLLGGVYAGRSDEISTHAAMPQLVGAVSEEGSLLAAARATTAGGAGFTQSSAPTTPVFAGISGGVGRLPLAVATDVIARGGEIVRGAVVRELQRTERGWRIVHGPTIAPTRVDADAVIIALPAAPASRLLDEVCHAASGELGRIDYASMAIITVAVDARSVDVDLAGSGFLVPPIDGRLIKAATYSSRKWAWLQGETVVLRCSVGRHREEADLQRDDTELVEDALLDIRDATGLHAPLLDAVVTRWGGALPQYAVGHVERVGRIRAAVQQVPGLEVCGAAYDGVGIPAVVASGRAAATRVTDALAPAATMGT
jgi:protoporphyrinogen/coproporphyrinogen III oxidase